MHAHRTVVAVVLAAVLALCLLAPRPAAAQFNMYALPVEKGSLSSGVELQLHYSSFEISSLGGSTTDVDIAILSARGAYALFNRLEIGLNVPFVTHVSTSSSNMLFGGSNSSDTRFGNIILELKGRIISLGEWISLAIFLDTTLPTHSGDGIREFAQLVPGAAASGEALSFCYGVAFKMPWMLFGEYQVGNTTVDIGNLGLIGLDFFFGYTVLGMITFQAAFQFANSVHPDTNASPFAVVPGVDVTLLKIIQLGLATRIAVNDDAKWFYGGRASLNFHGGIVF